ncbi:MAG TPA: alpha/beta hydrolase-fold protein [Gemmatimonadales bacterium]|nr:alpha/beta hydrolase-fold protein [Gemmatimonadales bacterium]
MAAPRWVEAQGRIVFDTLHSRALRGNLVLDAPDREVLVYLPPSYAHRGDARYPVVYLLHGATSTAREWIDGTYEGFDLRLAMDSLAAAGAAEFIVVMLDADNQAGAVLYVDSPASGRWEALLTKELVGFIDGRYRTLRDAEHRGLVGFSLGGLAALHLAPRHPDLFGHVYAMSPCCLGFVAEMAPSGDAWVHGAMRQWRMAAAFAPALGEPPHFGRLPFAVRPGGGVDSFPDVLARWRRGLPLERVTEDADALRRLRSLAIEVGTRESPAFSVLPGTRAYAQALQRLGVPHHYIEFDGGHADRTRTRLATAVLPHFARVFAAP